MALIVLVIGGLLNVMYAQGDTLSYKITSVFPSGEPRVDRTELVSGIVINAYYQDGVHYYWTKKLSADEKEKELYEFEYAEAYNFNSDLTIKVSFASYSNTTYAGYGVTVTNNYNTPTYSLDRIIKVYKDKTVVYKYAAGQLWWTYYYNKEGILQYGINGGNKSIYNVGDSLVTTVAPSGDTLIYHIGDDGIARRKLISNGPLNTTYTIWDDSQRLRPKVVIPKSKNKK